MDPEKFDRFLVFQLCKGSTWSMILANPVSEDACKILFQIVVVEEC